MVVPEDQVPLTVKPGAWVMYAACLTTDDPATTAEIAAIVGTAVVRESFFGLATAYTVEEVVRLSSMLAETDSSLTIEDSREAVQLDLLQLLDDEEGMTPEGRATAAAAEVVRRRSTRRDARAKRAEERAAETVKTITAKTESEVRIAEQKVAAVTEGRTEQAAALEAEKTKTRQLRRLVGVLVVALVLGGTIAGLLASRTIHGATAVVTYLVGAIYAVESVRFCRNLDVKWSEQVITAVGAGAWTIIGVIISKG